MEHLIACRIDDIPGKDTLNSFLKLVKNVCPDYIVSRELGKKTKKVHYHCQMSVTYHRKSGSLKKTIRRNLRKECGLHIHNRNDHVNCGKKCKKDDDKFYVETTTDLPAHLKYLMKDLDIIADTWSDRAQIAECLKETKRINNEKKTKMKFQVLELIKTNMSKEPTYVGSNPHLLLEKIYKDIIEYHVDRDYLPPSRTLLTQYSGFVVVKLLKESMIYTDLLDAIYNL